MKKDCQLIYASLVFFLIIFFNGFGQDFSPNHNLDLGIKSYLNLQDSSRDSLVFWQEQVVLHVANEFANKNKPIFFKGYLLTGVQQKRFGRSGVLNVELLDQDRKVLKRQFHQVDDGMVTGTMELPKKINSGKYYLRAYTQWMKNYEEKFYSETQIIVGGSTNDISETENNPDVFILPEGGTLLNGLENRMVVKVQDFKKIKEWPKGSIIDEEKNEVARIDFDSTGIGMAIFKPEKNRHYQLELDNGYSHPIPMAKNQGYLLHVNNIDPSNAKIRVTASSYFLGKIVKLIGIARGVYYIEKELNFKDGNVLDIELPKRDIPNGVLVLKLIDVIGTELARRPIWVDHDRLLIQIKPFASTGDEKAYQIRVTDINNTPIKTQLALSVNRSNNAIKKTSEAYTRESSVLLENHSWIKGNMVSLNRKERFLLDLNLLACNYSTNYFQSYEVGSNSTIKYPLQKGLELSGYAYDLDNKLLANTKIQVVAQTKEEVWVKEVETDSKGLLKLEEIQITGAAKLVFRTKGNSTETRLVKITLLEEEGVEGLEPDEWALKENKEIPLNNNESGKDKAKIGVVSAENSFKKLIEIDTTGLIELREVEVVEQKLKHRNSMPSMYGIEIPKARIKYQDPKRPRSIGQMLSEIPGVMVSGLGTFDPKVSILRGAGPVLWVLDGLPLPQSNGGQSFGAPAANSVRQIMSLISELDIERIELMIGSEASIYGTRGAGGIILIYSRAGNDLKFISRKKGQLIFQGYEPILEFESYYESLAKRTKEKTDLIYWNPTLETDKNGEAIIKFKSVPDDISSISIKASTITPNGTIGSISVVH